MYVIVLHFALFLFLLTSAQVAIYKEPPKAFLVDMTSGNKENVLYFQPEDLTALKDQMKMLTAIVMELEEKSKQNRIGLVIQANIS